MNSIRLLSPRRITLVVVLYGVFLKVASSLSLETPSSSSDTPSSCLRGIISRRDTLRVAGGTLTASILTSSSGKTPPAAVAFLPPSSSSSSPALPPGPPLPHLAKEYYDVASVSSRESAGRSFFPTLTPPFFHRATFRYDLGRNMWALEQLLAFNNVTATIRTNVVRLQDGNSLWVHSPQWPTGELMSLLDELGTVRHVVLPCNALEHNAPLRDFLLRYPNASVWISPGQYGPFGSCGTSLAAEQQPCKMGYRVDGILKLDHRKEQASVDTLPPSWADEFDYQTLYLNLPGNAGPVSEVAFFHRPTRTLLTVDAVVFIPDERPPSGIFETYFDKATVDDPSFWPRTVLQSVFLPLRCSENNGEYPGFRAIQGRLLRAPILRGFNDARSPVETLDWISRICSSWKFDRIVTSHFASPIVATPRDLLGAFAYLDPKADGDSTTGMLPRIACRDWELLDGLNEFIAEQKLGAPAVFDYHSDCVS